MIIAGIPLNNLNLFVSALGVGIGFGLQSLIANLISGIIIAFEKPVYVGDIIEVDGTRGRVTDIGIRATTVDTTDGAEFIVPNGDMIGKVLKNWTLTSKHFKVETNINTSLDADPVTVIALINEIFDEVPKVLTKPKRSATLTEILPHSLHFSVSCWVNSISDAKQVKNEILTRIHAKFREAGIRYPKNIKD
jgi:small-conductance mechanosensitive channel